MMKTTSILIKHIQQQALAYKNKIAIEIADGESISYQSLIENIQRYTHALSALGLHQGDRIMLVLSNRLEYIHLILACANSDIVYSPLLANFDSSTRKKAIETIAPKYIITDGCRDIDPLGVAVVHINMLDTHSPSSITPSSDHFYSGLFRMLWSSGSTGLPKIIQWRQDKLLWERLRWQQALNITSEDIFFCRHTLDVAHATDLHLFSSVLAGATLVLCKGDESQETINEYLYRYKPTVMSALPYHYDLLADSAQQRDFSFIQKPLCGGMYISQSLVEKVHEKTGLFLMPLYGSTDFGLAMLSAYPNALNLELKLVPGVSAEIIPIDVKNSRIGELCLHSPYMSEGYLNNDNANIKTFQGDRYVTGDIAKKLDSGNYLILGRTKDVLLVNNGFIMSTTLETLLKEKIPDYDFACLPKGKNHIYVAVSPIHTTKTSLLRSLLDKYFSEMSINWQGLLFNQFPRTPVGKVNKPQILDCFEHMRENDDAYQIL